MPVRRYGRCRPARRSARHGETDALYPLHLVQKVHAIVLSGGSAFGLDAASGAVRYLEERGVGFDVGVARVPIVPSAILFDLGLGRADLRPDAGMGYQACLNASSAPACRGQRGAGTGATVGKVLGMQQAMKSGTGSACLDLDGGLLVGALAAVNAFGDILDPSSGQIIAGARLPGAAGFADTLQVMKAAAKDLPRGFSRSESTVIGVVATNALLTKEGANKVAQMAHDGLARDRPSGAHHASMGTRSSAWLPERSRRTSIWWAHTLRKHSPRQFCVGCAQPQRPVVYPSISSLDGT